MINRIYALKCDESARQRASKIRLRINFEEYSIKRHFLSLLFSGKPGKVRSSRFLKCHPFARIERDSWAVGDEIARVRLPRRYSQVFAEHETRAHSRDIRTHIRTYVCM